MATITINIPDAVLPRVLDAFAGTYHYQNPIVDPRTGDSSPNPQTKAQFAKAKLIEHVTTLVRDYERKAAMIAAEAEATTKVQNEIVIS